MNNTGQGRLSHLDGLRGLAALNVAVSHFIAAFDFALFSGNASESHASWDMDVSGWPLLLPVSGSNLSVCVFLVLSGFVLAKAAAESGMGPVALIAKRVVRLGLPIAVSLAISVLLISSPYYARNATAALSHSSWLATSPANANLSDVFTQTLSTVLFGLVGTGAPANPPLWTMLIEFLGSYILFVVVGSLRSTRVGGVILLAAGVLLSGHYIGLMFLGGALQLLRLDALAGLLLKYRVIAFATLACALLLGTIPLYVQTPAYWSSLVSHSPMLPPIQAPAAQPALRALGPIGAWHGFAAILLLLVCNTSPMVKVILAHRTVQWLGTVSFPLYILHYPILLSGGCGLFVAMTGAGLSYWTAVAVAFVGYMALALVAAHLGLLLVERPSLYLSRRVGDAATRI